MIGRSLAAAMLAAMLAVPSGGCAFAVEHPAVAAGVVGGALGFSTCKLASDNLGACAAVGGGAGAFLGLVAAAALWLGGDGHTAPVEETAQPLPDDGRPRRRHHRPAEPPATDAPSDPAASAPPPVAAPSAATPPATPMPSPPAAAPAPQP